MAFSVKDLLRAPLSKAESTMVKDGALKLVLYRNAFYRDGYKRLLFCLLLLLAVNGLLGFAVFYRYTHPPQPQYFAATADGRLIAIHPLTDPVLSDQQVLQFVAKAVRDMYALDYIHWRAQLQHVQSYFTVYGWQYYIDALRSSDNLNTLRKLKMVVSSQITGAPHIARKTIISGRYAWKVEVPLLVTYRGAKGQAIRQSMKVTLIILRVAVQDNPSRIAINNFIPQLSGNA